LGDLRRFAGDGGCILVRRGKRPLPGCSLRPAISSPALAVREPGGVPELPRRLPVALPLFDQPRGWPD
jgi:hypothetical protein